MRDAAGTAAFQAAKKIPHSNRPLLVVTKNPRSNRPFLAGKKNRPFSRPFLAGQKKLGLPARTRRRCL